VIATVPNQAVKANQTAKIAVRFDGEVVAHAEPAIVDEEPGFRGRGRRGSGNR